jgi:hypothetical protein
MHHFTALMISGVDKNKPRIYREKYVCGSVNSE